MTIKAATSVQLLRLGEEILAAISHPQWLEIRADPTRPALDSRDWTLNCRGTSSVCKLYNLPREWE